MNSRVFQNRLLLASGVAAVCLVGANHAYTNPKVAWTEKTSKSPFTWPELEKGIQERKVQEKQLKVLSVNVISRLQELQKLVGEGKLKGEEYQERFLNVKKEVVLQAQQIVWGVGGEGAREAFLEQNGCVKINSDAIEAIKSLKMKVVEMGAGTGHWAKALKDAGIDVIAFDNEESLPVPSQKNLFPVKKGDPSMLTKHKDRALLLVYPPQTSMAEDSVKVHNGQVVIYCGEGSGGVNATHGFFALLEDQFKVEKQIATFEPFGTKSYERMWILRRQSK